MILRTRSEMAIFSGTDTNTWKWSNNKTPPRMSTSFSRPTQRKLTHPSGQSFTVVLRRPNDLRAAIKYECLPASYSMTLPSEKWASADLKAHFSEGKIIKRFSALKQIPLEVGGFFSNAWKLKTGD
ncbi:MAG: hypothetical protein AAF625_13245 [Pseudomonadota bacterium]